MSEVPKGIPEMVGAAIAAIVKLAVETERERCAKIAMAHIIPGHTVGQALPNSIAEAIRKETER